MHPIISFAIASYNRCDLTYKLVLDLLSSSDERIEVLVVDDASSDETLDKLKGIEDQRLRVYRHTENLGPKMTWFDVYEQAQGEWIFCNNDRDVIKVDYIDNLINTLEILEKKNVGFAVAGEKWNAESTKDYKIFKEGIDTIAEFGIRGQHPSGQIFRRKCWLEIDNRIVYFSEDKYGIYPHGFIEAIIGNRYCGAYIFFDICDKEHYTERMRWMYPSGVYKEHGKEYFLPSQKYSLLELLVDNVELVDKRNFTIDLILKRYVRWFKEATVNYYWTMNDSIIRRRYGYENECVSLDDIKMSGENFVKNFRNYIRNKKYAWIDNTFWNGLKEIEKRCCDDLEDWLFFKKYETPVYDNDNVILFGAGRRGIKAITSGINPKGICDNSPEQIGKQMCGLTIKSLEECEIMYDSNTVFLITPIDMEAVIFIAKQLTEKGYRYKFF